MRKAYKVLCCVLTVTALCSGCKKEEPQETVTEVETTQEETEVAETPLAAETVPGVPEDLQIYRDADYFDEYAKEVRIGEDIFNMPIKVSDLIDKGYSLPEDKAVAAGESIETALLGKDGESLYIELEIMNPFDADTSCTEGYVEKFTITDDTPENVKLYAGVYSQVDMDYISSFFNTWYDSTDAYVLPGNDILGDYVVKVSYYMSNQISEAYVSVDESLIEKAAENSVPQEVVEVEEFTYPDEVVQNFNKVTVDGIEIQLPIKLSELMSLGIFTADKDYSSYKAFTSDSKGMVDSQPEILYRTNPDYKDCIIGIDLWYPEKDTRDVPVYDCYVTAFNVNPDSSGEKPTQTDITFCGGLKLGAPREEVATMLKSTYIDESGKVTYEYYVNKDEFSESFTVWVDNTGNVSHLSIDVRDYVRYE